eukprot:24106-Chlamydomonas_euryale.AAC.1
MQHREACCSALAFLARLLDPAVLGACPPGSAEARAAALAPRGPVLARLLLAGVAGCVPTSRLPDVSSALTALLKAARQEAVVWLGEALAALPVAAVSPADCKVWPRLLDGGGGQEGGVGPAGRRVAGRDAGGADGGGSVAF